ncbi:MAG: hypothetical protein JW776_13305 [Candidatus Lokiarchaeota archaeon]|nr:hypothetical protein [Candidatus Lokiarchaeota archaeon]
MKASYLEVLKEFPQDTEWSRDWSKITEVFDTIEYLESLFDSFEVSYLRELQQQMLILNLKKYAWSLQGLIVEKYRTE